MEIIDALDFTDYRTLLTSFLLLFIIVFLRYIILSGTYHWIFLILYRKRFGGRILSSRDPKNDQIKRELLLSAYSAVIFSLTGLIILILWQKDLTKIYSDIQEYPLWYLPVSIVIYLFIHDFYYYWLHRWMHSSKFMRSFHMEHHRSVHTTVFTSFSFHPMESLLQAVIVPIIIMIVPMSTLAILITLSLMTFSAIVNHAGVEIYPMDRKYRVFRKYVIGATHHDHHHKNSKKNFGLYFTFWDRIMKTER
jgi:sterol desaturase/sphingolipid hydroxylase (fatty acid hydroxylase superfamily)